MRLFNISGRYYITALEEKAWKYIFVRLVGQIEPICF